VHDEAARYLVEVLRAWAARIEDDVQIARNLAIRWIERAPNVGIDPDVCVLHPPPPERTEVDSLRLWMPGHQPPPLCFEVVSKNHPHKDYAEVHERYAAMGAHEVVVFDPLLAGPKLLGGPVSLQVWRRDPLGVLDRVYFGPGPARSEVLDAWLIVDGKRLAIASNRAGEHRWHTEAEHQRAEAERQRAEAEHQRAEAEHQRTARLELERRVAELERQRH
jgi:Uma2 family endonuclease